MDRRSRRRGLRPGSEPFVLESREVLSALGTHVALREAVASTRAAALPIQPLPASQNQILNPTGSPRRHEGVRQAFQASFGGAYTLGPGRYTSQKSQLAARGMGTSTAFLNGTGTLAIVTPKDPSEPFTGVILLMDRNTSLGSQLSLLLTGSRQDVDRFGRPTVMTYQVDDGGSGGVFANSSGQGTVQFRYTSHSATTGSVAVRIRGEVYAVGVTTSVGMLKSIL